MHINPKLCSKSRSLLLLVAVAVLAVLAGTLRLAAQESQISNQSQARSFAVLHTFMGSAYDGAMPYFNPLLNLNGTLYGTTAYGGPYGGFNGSGGSGTVFKLDKNGDETILYTFTGGPDGAEPDSILVQDEEGSLYGTTQDGGLSCDAAALYGLQGCGVVFKLDRSGKETVLYSFTGGMDGGMPASVTMGSDGNLYGLASVGGDMSCPGGWWDGYGCGVVFKMDRGGNETVLHSFSGVPDGAIPFPFLTMDDSGNIYGAAQYGGSASNPAVCFGSGCGVVFKLDRKGDMKTLYTFTGGADGFLPNGPLLLDDKGNLYGDNELGGDPTCFCGVAFKLDSKRNMTILHTFTGGADGASPWSGMSWGADGNLYGTTYFGGTANAGTVFQITPKGSEKVLYNFTDMADGGNPGAVLIMDPRGNLYGTTQAGGDLLCSSPAGTGCGVVFELKQ